MTCIPCWPDLVGAGLARGIGARRNSSRILNDPYRESPFWRLRAAQAERLPPQLLDRNAVGNRFAERVDDRAPSCRRFRVWLAFHPRIGDRKIRVLLRSFFPPSRILRGVPAARLFPVGAVARDALLANRGPIVGRLWRA